MQPVQNCKCLTVIKYKGVRLILLFDDQVIMKVEHPKVLDPTFNLSAGSV